VRPIPARISGASAPAPVPCPVLVLAHSSVSTPAPLPPAGCIAMAPVRMAVPRVDLAPDEIRCMTPPVMLRLGGLPLCLLLVLLHRPILPRVVAQGLLNTREHAWLMAEPPFQVCLVFLVQEPATAGLPVMTARGPMSTYDVRFLLHSLTGGFLS
jgi:hypothetical protein